MLIKDWTRNDRPLASIGALFTGHLVLVLCELEVNSSLRRERRAESTEPELHLVEQGPQPSVAQVLRPRRSKINTNLSAPR